MGIHQAVIGGYSNSTAPVKTWSVVGSDDNPGSSGATVSVANCQSGDQAWFAWSLDTGSSTYNPTGYTIVKSSAINTPDFALSKKTITSSGTETVDVPSAVDNSILMVFRSSTNSIVNTTDGNDLSAERSALSGMPTTPSANSSNRTAPSGALALNVGFLDDDNPSNLAAPSGYSFIVAGNTDDGSSTSSLFSAYAETTSASTAPPGAGNPWTATGENSDQNDCVVVYLIHGS